MHQMEKRLSNVEQKLSDVSGKIYKIGERLDDHDDRIVILKNQPAHP